MLKDFYGRFIRSHPAPDDATSIISSLIVTEA